MIICHFISTDIQQRLFCTLTVEEESFLGIFQVNPQAMLFTHFFIAKSFIKNITFSPPCLSQDAVH